MSETAIEMGSEVQQTVESLMPFLGGDATSEKKAEYLSYRFTGFSIREACALTDIHERTVKRWRGQDSKEGPKHYDPVFTKLEHDCTGENRHKVRREVISLLFTRNLHLAMRRDYELFKKALGFETIEMSTGEVVTIQPTKEEHAYINRARGQYTPAQIEAVERMIDPETGSKFNFAEFVVQMARETRDGDTIVTERMEARASNGVMQHGATSAAIGKEISPNAPNLDEG